MSGAGRGARRACHNNVAAAPKDGACDDPFSILGDDMTELTSTQKPPVEDADDAEHNAEEGEARDDRDRALSAARALSRQSLVGNSDGSNWPKMKGYG